MGSFDIQFTPGSSGENGSFILTFLMREHSLALGYYVIYPSITQRKLLLVPKYKFDSFERRFEELSEKIHLAKKEKDADVKPKNRKYYVSEAEIKEAKELRFIISHSHTFSIRGYETSAEFPHKFLDILQIKGDSLTFIPSAPNEFIIINPADAWLYSANNINNIYYNNVSDDDSPKSFFKIRRAI